MERREGTCCCELDVKEHGCHQEQTLVSAPGKVLVIGGYLITERPKRGLVFSVTARIFALVRPRASSEEGFLGSGITVRSPQFNIVYHYGLLLPSAPGELPSLQAAQLSQPKNQFVEETLAYTLAALFGLMEEKHQRPRLEQVLRQGLDITIAGDPAFYSAENSNKNVGPQKTGLGSSAAVVTALVAALLSHFGCIQLDETTHKQEGSEEGLRLLHNLAQYCHYKAQGKLGSGFDVSSAVYGCQIYTRFSPSVIASFEQKYGQLEIVATGPAFLELLRSEAWDDKHERLGLPPGMLLMLGDRSEGAHTPGMVAKVMAWKAKMEREDTVEENLWQRLNRANEQALGLFATLWQHFQEETQIYYHSLDICSKLPPSQWNTSACRPLGPTLAQLRITFMHIRRCLKQMGEQSTANIEPAPQTELADATMEVTGTLLAGVPGAGGMDALFAVVLGFDSQQRVEQLWQRHNVRCLLLEEEKNGLQLHREKSSLPLWLDAMLAGESCKHS